MFVWEQDAIREPMLDCTGWSPPAVLWICLHAFHSGAPIDPGASCYHHYGEKRRKILRLIWFWRCNRTLPGTTLTKSSIWHPQILPHRNLLPIVKWIWNTHTTLPIMLSKPPQSHCKHNTFSTYIPLLPLCFLLFHTQINRQFAKPLTLSIWLVADM